MQQILLCGVIEWETTVYFCPLFVHFKTLLSTLTNSAMREGDSYDIKWVYGTARAVCRPRPCNLHHVLFFHGPWCKYLCSGLYRCSDESSWVMNDCQYALYIQWNLQTPTWTMYFTHTVKIVSESWPGLFCIWLTRDFKARRFFEMILQRPQRHGLVCESSNSI